MIRLRFYFQKKKIIIFIYVVYPERILVQVWRLTLNHLDGHDTETPNVDLGTVLFARDDLGSHPVRGSDHGRSLCGGLAQLSAKTKVGELDASVEREKDVIRLDITVNDVLRVQVLEAEEGLQNNH